MKISNKWLKKRRERKTSKLLRAFYLWIYKGHIPRKEFSVMLNCRSQLYAARILAQLKELSSGHISMRFERYITWRKIDNKLLKCARNRHGLKRALIMKTLYLLPLPRWSEQKIASYLDDKNSYVRIFALLSSLEYDLPNAAKILLSYKHEFSSLDYSMLAMFFHRHTTSSKFHSLLLESQDDRLEILALYIIRISNNYGLGTEIISRLPSDNQYINFEIIKTLITIHHPLNHPSVIESFCNLRGENRKYLYRLACSQGYSLASLEKILLCEKHAYMVDYVVTIIQGGKYKLNSTKVCY